MLTISLLEFIRSGDFGPLSERANRDGVMALLGPPDGFGGNPSEEEAVYVLEPDGEGEYRPATSPRDRNHAGIWFYGDFEVHFESRAEDAVAWMVYTDQFYRDSLAGGSNLCVDPWVIRKGLELESFLLHLEEEGIGLVSRDLLPRQEVTKVVLASEVEALFLSDEEPPKWQIHSLYRIWPKPDTDSEPETPQSKSS